MKQFYSTRTCRGIAFVLLQATLLQIGYPTACWALTSGPAQPEFSGFQPVGVSDLVNKFTGDFSYSVPVMEVPGPQGSSYPLTLAYHSGANAEEEASWVGYGWNLSPGAINRNARGLPDDFNNEPVVYRNKIPRNFTLTAGTAVGVELFSFDRFTTGLNANVAIRYNNYSGFGYDRGIGISLAKGLISLGITESDSRKSYSARINPMAIIALIQDKKSDPERDRINAQTVKFDGNQALASSAYRTLGGFGSTTLLGGNHGTLDYNEGSRATQVPAYTGAAYGITFGAAINPGPFPIGANANLSGSFAYQDATDNKALSSYGYLYSAEANAKKTSGEVMFPTKMLSRIIAPRKTPLTASVTFFWECRLAMQIISASVARG